MRWSPSPAGRLLTRTDDWSLVVDQDNFKLKAGGNEFFGRLFDLQSTQIVEGFIWSKAVLPRLGDRVWVLDGLPRQEARELRRVIDSAVVREEQRQRAAELIDSFPSVVGPILEWSQRLRESVRAQFKRRGWLDQWFMEEVAQSRPRGFEEWQSEPVVQEHLRTQPEEVQQALALLADTNSVAAWTDSLNEQFRVRRCVSDQRFFEQVEKSPLTEEQRAAVVCFDARVLLVASAGSGKTSTMVAKAGYALRHGYFDPERILMLAFNNDAAAELRQRLHARLGSQGLAADAINAKTFHAFGLEVIGEATGIKPGLAPWLDAGRDLETILNLVDELKDKNLVFRAKWDLFRIVLSQDLRRPGDEEEEADSWDSAKGRGGFWTANDEVVKSRGEQLLANWLFYNGVRYEYEKPYEHPTADAEHRQYHPDFYFPDANAYLEHWALDERGEPPEDFEGYKESMAWKRALHKKHGTKLLETTTADLWSGKVFERLPGELTELGIVLDPDPERPVRGRQPIENPRLVRTFRMFQTHVKNNRLGMEELRQRASEGNAGRFQFRNRIFLDLFEAISKAWEEKLNAGGHIDFEDMLNLATDHIEQGRWTSPYELVMVDEFQDASLARARMVKALVQQPHRYLFAVGDDWQSINRFAGADLSVMTRFTEVFGSARTLKLETTFRCPQSLCDIAGQFIQKNPAQLKKHVRSAKPEVSTPVSILVVDQEQDIRASIDIELKRLGREALASQKRRTVYVLGRYRKDADYFPANATYPGLTVEFITVHSSKGLECDHVVIPRMTSDTMGFPSRIEDDPIMGLAMPSGDRFEFSEERRLFYVAMTRAKRSVCLVTVKGKESTFLLELVREHGIQAQRADGTVDPSPLCPECGKGFLVLRTGKFGDFFGCTSYPRCRFTAKASDQSNAQARNTRQQAQGSGTKTR